MAKRAKPPPRTPAAASVSAPTPLPPHYVKMIWSGGQTGVDRAALEIAMELGIPHGGWCPKGRLAEDGTIATHFKLKETTSSQYWIRTEKNVVETEGTLILFCGQLTRGSALTRKYAQRHRRPYQCVLLQPGNESKDIRRIRRWLNERKIQILNIAGPRESTSAGIAGAARTFLRQLFIRPRHSAPPKKAKRKSTRC